MARIQDCTFVFNGKEYSFEEFRAMLYKNPDLKIETEKAKNQFESEKTVNIQEETELKDKTDIGDIPDEFILGNLIDSPPADPTINDFEGEPGRAYEVFDAVKEKLSSILGEDFVNGNQLIIGPGADEKTNEYYGFVRRVIDNRSIIPNAYKSIMLLNSTTLWNVEGEALRTAKHEAIHFVVWSVLSPEERKKLHESAIKAWELAGSPTRVGLEYDPKNKMKQAEEWLAQTYEKYTREPSSMEKIPGIIGRFFRWLYDTYQRIVNNRSEIDQFLASVERGDFRNRAKANSLMYNNLSYKDYSQLFSDENITEVSDREYSTAMEDAFNKLGIKSGADLFDKKLPVESIKALGEDSDISRKEQSALVRNQFDNISQIRRTVFGSDYVYLRAVQILKDKLNSNGLYSKDMKYEFIHGDSPASKNKHIYSAWADFYSVAERLMKNAPKIEGLVVNGTIINSVNDLSAETMRYLDKNQRGLIDQYIAIQLSNKEVLAPMIESIYELDIMDIVEILRNDGAYSDNSVKREIEETEDTDERAENAIYAERMTKPVIDKQSRLLRFRIDSISRYNVSNAHMLGQAVNKNINNGKKIIEKTSDFVPRKALEEAMRNISNSPIYTAEDLRKAVQKRITEIPDGEEKTVLMSLWMEVFDSWGVRVEDQPGNSFPVISHYAFINRTNDELWAEHVKFAKRLNNNKEALEEDDKINFFKKQITKDQFFKWADRKRAYSEDIYNAITSMYINTGFVSTSKAMYEDGFVRIRENGFGSANAAIDNIRTGLMSKLVFDGNGLAVSNDKMFFGDIAQYSPNINKEAYRVQFIINKDGLFYRPGSKSDSNKSYIRILDFKDGKIEIPGEMKNHQATHKTYLIKFLRASGLDSRFGHRVWNEIIATPNLGMNYLVKTAGMYAITQDLGYGKTLDGSQLKNRWSYRYKDGVPGDEETKPIKNDFLPNNEEFYWPTDLVSINKTIAAAYMAGSQIGFMSSTKTVNGNTMYLHENKSFFNRVIQNKAEITILGKDGKIKEQTADAALYDYFDRNKRYFFTNLNPETSSIPNSFLNPLYGKGKDKLIAYYENLGIQGQYSGASKDSNFNINDEFNFAIDFFEKTLRSNIGSRGGYRYTVPLQAFGDHETTYVTIQLGDEGILGVNGDLDMSQVANRVETIMDYHELLYNDSIERWKQFFATNGLPNEVSGFKETIRLQNNQNPNFARLIEKSPLIKNVDYVIKGGKVKYGNAVNFANPEEPGHKIFNRNNLLKLRNAKGKEEKIKVIEEIFFDNLADFGKTVSGYAFNGVQHHTIPKDWRSKGPIYKDGKLNPYYKGFYFIQFVTRHQIMPLLGANAFAYKDSIDRQKRISQMKTPISVASDSGNLFGGYVRAVVFKDLSVAGDPEYNTGIGKIARKDISDTDGFGLMHPLFAEGAWMAYGGDAGLINEGNQKFLSNVAGQLWKASWGKMTDDVLVNDMNDDHDGYSYWNVIEKGFVNPEHGKQFVNDLKSELAKKQSSTERYSAVRKVSRDWINKIRSGELGPPGISNYVAGFFMADSGLKTYQSKINLLTDNDLANNYHEIPLEMFGHIMDPSQNISNDPSASSPIQVVTQTAWAQNEQANAVYDLWGKIIEAQNKQRAVPIDKLRERYIKTISSVGAFGHAAEMLTDPNISINLPGLSSIIRSSHMSSVQRNQVRFSVPGARMTQQPGRNIKFVDENGVRRSLKPVLFTDTKDGKKMVEPGEVFMPHMFLDKFFDKEELDTMGNFITPEIIRARLANRDEETKQAFEDSLMIFADRIPSGGLNSGYVMKVVGFVNDNQNTIYLPSEVNVLNGADYDIDQLQIWVLKPSKTVQKDGSIKTIVKRDESVTGLINQLLDKFFEIYKDPANAEFTGNTTSIDIPNEVKDYVIKAISSGEGASNQANSFVNNDDYTGDLVRKNVVALGSVAIGRFANISKAASLLKQAGTDILGPGYDIKPYAIQEIDKWLNAALDNEKHNILGILSARPELGDFIIAYTIMNYDPNKKWKLGDKEYTGAGSTFLELARIFQMPAMKELIKDLEKLATVNLRDDKDEGKFSWEIEQGLKKKILGTKPTILDLVALQRRRIIQGKIKVDNDTEGSKIESQIDQIEKIAAFGEALSRIGLGLPVTNIPKTEHGIRKMLFEIGTMVNTDPEKWIESGEVGTNPEQIEAARMRRYEPFIEKNSPEYRYFLKKEELINEAVDFSKFIDRSQPIKAATKVIYEEWKKQKEMFKIDLDEKVFNQAQKFFNEVMFNRGLVSDRVLEEVRDHFNRYLISLYFTINPPTINATRVNVATDEDKGDEMAAPQRWLDISKFDLSTYSGRQGFLMTVPLWFRAKVEELKRDNDQAKVELENNLFWRNLEIYEDNGITVFRMRNMNQIKEIKDEVKHDAYILFNMLSPDGSVAEVIKNYQMLLNGFNYGKGSMSVIFEPNEFYKISDFIENTIVPALEDNMYNQNTISLRGKSFSMKDLIEGEFAAQLVSFLDSSMKHIREKKEQKEEKKPIEIPGQLIWQAEYDKTNKLAAYRMTSDGVEKIKISGVGEPVMAKARKLGYNTMVNPDTPTSIFTANRTIRTFNGNGYVDLQENDGLAGISIPYGSIPNVGDRVYVDGMLAIVESRSAPGQPQKVYVRIQNFDEVFKSRKTDIKPDGGSIETNSDPIKGVNCPF